MVTVLFLVSGYISALAYSFMAIQSIKIGLIMSFFHSDFPSKLHLK